MWNISLENDGVVLNFVSNGGDIIPRNDTSFQDILQLLITKNTLKFTVIIEMPSKPFSEWSFQKCANSIGLAVTQILTLMCSLFFYVVLLS